MMIRDREEDQAYAMQVAEPLLPGLHEILHEAFALYHSDDYSAAVRAEHDDRAAANCVYAHAEKALVRRFDGMPGVKILSIRTLRVMNYSDQLLFRIKKVNARGRHRNYQTKQQRDYDAQRPLPGLPEPAIRLTAGYQPDMSGSLIERIIISRPLGKTVYWASQVVCLEEVARWIDITPPRFAGTGNADYGETRAGR